MIIIQRVVLALALQTPFELLLRVEHGKPSSQHHN